MNQQLHGNTRSAHPSATGEVDCYVYYRVRVEFATRLQVRVTSMQNHLLREFGIVGKLKRRPQPHGGLDTWMEIYTAVPQNFAAILASEVFAAKLPELINGERYTEHFEDVTCA